MGFPAAAENRPGSKKNRPEGEGRNRKGESSSEGGRRAKSFPPQGPDGQTGWDGRTDGGKPPQTNNHDRTVCMYIRMIMIYVRLVWVIIH